MRRPFIIGLTALVAALALFGLFSLGDVVLGRTVIESPEEPPSPRTATSTPPTKGCPPVTENATDGTLNTAPDTQWVQATDRVWLPKTKGGPLKDSNGYGQCFTPDAEGALTAAYYYWAMSDSTFPEETRRAALTSYISDKDPGKQETISRDLSGGEWDASVRGFSFAMPVQQNHAVVNIFPKPDSPGGPDPSEIRLIWEDGTWHTGLFIFEDYQPQDNPMVPWTKD